MDRAPVSVQTIGQRLADIVEDSAQIAPSPAFRFVPPKEGSQLLAGDGFALGAEIAEQAQGLARFQPSDGLAVVFNLNRAEKTDVDVVEFRHKGEPQ